MRRVLDTNVALYLLGGRLAEHLPEGEYSISVITEMELLSYPDLDEADVREALRFAAAAVRERELPLASTL